MIGNPAKNCSVIIQLLGEKPTNPSHWSWYEYSGFMLFPEKRTEDGSTESLAQIHCTVVMESLLADTLLKFRLACWSAHTFNPFFTWSGKPDSSQLFIWAGEVIPNVFTSSWYSLNHTVIDSSEQDMALLTSSFSALSSFKSGCFSWSVIDKFGFYFCPIYSTFYCSFDFNRC